MHIADGILNAGVTIGTFAATGVITTVLSSKIKRADIPKISAVTAVLFVASLLRIHIGPTSVHPVLTGVGTIILGPEIFIATLVALFFQSIMFAHGGITALGANVLAIGGGALIVSLLCPLLSKLSKKKIILYISLFLIGFISIMSSAFLTSLILITTGESFSHFVNAVIIAHIPVAVIEGILTIFIAFFLSRVRPGLLIYHSRNTRFVNDSCTSFSLLQS